jgi:hypothetical protein
MIMNIRKYFFLGFLLIFCNTLSGQELLKPGFDASEYADLLGLTHKTHNPANTDRLSVPVPVGYEHVYRSEKGPLDNLWDLYIRKDGLGVLEIRGTTAKTKSWLENFYAGMVPAQGTIQIGENQRFNYKLAEDKRATVHVGWLTGLASMIEDILDKLNEYHGKGIKEYILMGHSQGGAIVFMLDSYLHYDPDDLVPDDMVFKTYNSAAPKPGNQHYAYDYAFINRGGWAFRIANPIDWVPETPITVQTLQDYNEVNPFRDMNTFTSSMGWLEKVVVNSIFRKTDRSLRKARNRLMKYLGFKLYGFIEEYMEGMVEPEYAVSMNYVTAGTPIILPPTSVYFEEYVSQAKQDVFRHHYGIAYYFLLTQHYDIE